MANPQNTEDIERMARALLEEGIDRRMAAVKELVAARDRLAKHPSRRLPEPGPQITSTNPDIKLG